MSIFHDAEKVAEGIAHHIPAPVADELKKVARKMGIEAWHFLVAEAGPAITPAMDALKAAYDLIPDSPEKEEALEKLKESAHLFLEAVIDSHTEPGTNTDE